MSTESVDVSVIVVADRRQRQELRFFRQLALIVGSFVAYMAVRAVANDAPSIAISNLTICWSSNEQSVWTSSNGCKSSRSTAHS